MQPASSSTDFCHATQHHTDENGDYDVVVNTRLCTERDFQLRFYSKSEDIYVSQVVAEDMTVGAYTLAAMNFPSKSPGTHYSSVAITTGKGKPNMAAQIMATHFEFINFLITGSLQPLL